MFASVGRVTLGLAVNVDPKVEGFREEILALANRELASKHPGLAVAKIPQNLST
jgi:hypothetical protein